MSKHRYSKEEIAEWRKEHKKVFYYNPEDSNFVIPKAYTMGFTFNWAHPLSWLVGAVIVALTVYVVFFSKGSLTV